MRIAIVGLGSVAAHHVGVLEDLPGVEVVAGVDPGGRPALTFRGTPVAHFSTVGELFAHEPVDAVIVTAPTPAHAEIVDQIARCPPCRVLVEKPLAASLADVRRLLSGNLPCDVQTLFHAAAAPEVVWACTAFGGFVDRHGAIVAIDMFVGDGRLSDAARLRPSLGDAWIDLGINALSVAARFVTLDSVELTDIDREQETYHARIGFRHGDVTGSGSVLVTWGGLEPSKHSVLRFGDGARLLLDHQAGAGVLTADGEVETLFVLDDARPRLQWHYRNLFEIVLAGGRVFDHGTELDLHEKLFGAVR